MKCENIAQILGKYYTNNMQILYKYCEKKILGKKKFRVKKIFRLKKFLAQKFVRSKKILGQKLFWAKEFFEAKIFFGAKIFLGHKNFPSLLKCKVHAMIEYFLEKKWMDMHLQSIQLQTHKDFLSFTSHWTFESLWIFRWLFKSNTWEPHSAQIELIFVFR